VYYQNYVLGELMASQLLGISTARFEVGELCWKSGNREYLVEKVFKPGARYDWNTMLEKATGEDLNPAHFIAQFV